MSRAGGPFLTVRCWVTWQLSSVQLAVVDVVSADTLISKPSRPNMFVISPLINIVTRDKNNNNNNSNNNNSNEGLI